MTVVVGVAAALAGMIMGFALGRRRGEAQAVARNGGIISVTISGVRR